MHIEYFFDGLRIPTPELPVMARKLGKLATYCSKLKDESSVIRIEAERRATKKKQDEVKVMLTIQLPRKIFRAESRKASLIEAIQRATDKIQPQLQEYKEMRTGRDRAHRAQRKAKRSETAYDLAA